MNEYGKVPLDSYQFYINGIKLCMLYIYETPSKQKVAYYPLGSCLVFRGPKQNYALAFNRRNV